MTAPGPAPAQLLSYGAHLGSSLCCAVERAHLDRGAPKRAVALPDESSVIVAALIVLNDFYPDTPEGDKARTEACGPYLSRLAGSYRSPEVEIRRDWLLADWPLRELAPLFFGELEETRAAAVALRALPEVVDRSTLDAALAILQPAARASRAAIAAERGAALNAVEGGESVEIVAFVGIARLAFNALDFLARDDAVAAHDALSAIDPIAARAAANGALSPLVERLRASERALLDRMFACGEVRS